MFRMHLTVFVFSFLAALAQPVAAQSATFEVSEGVSATWLCQYVISSGDSYIECQDPNYDEALSDEPRVVRRLQVYSLPANMDDVALAEQLVDAVLCINQPSCTAHLNPPRWG